MKKITFLVKCLLLTSTLTFAQNFTKIVGSGDETVLNSNNAACLNESQRAEIKATLDENVKRLKQQGKLTANNKGGAHPLFIWPVQQADHSNYESFWGLRDYVDHNAASPDMITDYNCGDRTFDNGLEGYNHQGTDIRIWPFYWDMMDNNKVEVIAGAAGQIIGKIDGNFDRNCDYSPNPWNAVYVQHNDGSVAWYGNLKNGSLTTKNIGDSVSQGEFLGIVGSSGVSYSPHLHFEVYDFENNLVDPYFGDCNSMNSDSWWQDQKPYYNTNINAVLTHSDWVQAAGSCPNTQDILNLQNDFVVGDRIYVYIYLRDQMPGTQVKLKVTFPDNTILEWTHYIFNYLSLSYYGWESEVLTGDDPQGTWSFEATYNEQTVIHYFNVGVLGVEDNSLAQTTVFPNPMQSKLYVKSEATILSADIRDVLGRSVIKISDITRSKHEIDVSFLSKGIYFITLQSDENRSKTVKLIKK